MGRTIKSGEIGQDGFSNIAANAMRAELASYIHDMLGQLSGFLPDAGTLNTLLMLAKVEAQHLRDDAKLAAANDGRDRHLAHRETAPRAARR